MPFISVLVVTPIPGKAGRFRIWKGCPLVYRGKTETFTIPAGFTTDFGSVPWFASWLVHPTFQVEAFVLHDWLYSSGEVSRQDADAIMRRVLRELGAGTISRWSAWVGVRLGGWLPWNRHEKRRRIST